MVGTLVLLGHLVYAEYDDIICLVRVKVTSFPSAPHTASEGDGGDGLESGLSSLHMCVPVSLSLPSIGP